MDVTKIKELIVIAGPTAAGKTKLAIQVAQNLQTEIISFDSRQLYKEMQIGTAVPSASQLAEVKHHFIQSHSIHDQMNAGIYESQALQKIKELFTKYSQLVFTGGTGLYMDAVLFGVDDLPAADQALRKKLYDELNLSGLQSLTAKLKIVDTETYHSIDLKNPGRVIRALEIYYLTGKPSHLLRKNQKKQRDFNYRIYIISKDRKQLYEHINKRVDEMIANGLEEEVKHLQPYRTLKALHTVGYTEIFDFLENKILYETAVERIKQNTRNYAKRQLTWFRKYEDAKWITADNLNFILNDVTSNQ